MKFSVCLRLGLMVSLSGFAGTALADSFCGYDEGLIGTKAIGSYPPAMMKTFQNDDDACQLFVFDTPPQDTSAPEVMDCHDFKRMPSFYVDQSLEQGYPTYKSEYFQFLIYDMAGTALQLELKSGGIKWAQLDSKYPVKFTYHYREDDPEVSMQWATPTQSAMFEAPDLSKRDPYFGDFYRKMSDRWFDRVVPYDYYSDPIFSVLERYGLFDPNDIEGMNLSRYADLFEITYETKKIVKDDDGREWLEAEEFLSIPEFGLFEKIKKKLEAEEKELSEDDIAKFIKITNSISKTGPLRTVYFPFREPSGTITMVMSYGSYCD